VERRIQDSRGAKEEKGKASEPDSTAISAARVGKEVAKAKKMGSPELGELVMREESSA